MTRGIDAGRDLPIGLTQTGTPRRTVLCLATVSCLASFACGQAEQAGATHAHSGGSSGAMPAAGAGVGGIDQRVSGGAGASVSGGASGTGGDAGGGETSKGEPVLHLEAVAARDGLYVAAGVLDGEFGSDSVILTSADATTWSAGYRGGNEVLAALAYGGGHWVAVGWGIADHGSEFVRSRSILVSPDGATWEPVTAPECEGFREVVWTGSEFLARGDLPTGAGLWASADGQEWTERQRGSAVPAKLTLGSPGLLGTLGDAVALSKDGGSNWTLSPVPRVAGELGARSVKALWPDGHGFGGAGFRTCCYGEQPGLDRYFLLQSEDGLAWDWTQTEEPVPFTVAQRGERWVGIAHRDGGLLYRDTPAAVWTRGMPADVSAVAAGDRFVAVGSGIFSSEDGVLWNAAALPSL